MAFFGLTALGPQNTFACSLKGASDLQIFSDEDWRLAFEAVAVEGALRRDDVTALLEALYRGPAPVDDAARFAKAAEAALGSGWDALACAQVLRAVQQLRADMTQLQADEAWRARASCGTTSNEEYRNRVRRHRGLHLAPQEQYAVPLKAAQDLGWQQRPPGEGAAARAHSKKSCEETKFAAEMVKSGMYF
eukprot:TRINITY_DN27019_c0_g1_i1.p1 TRINITY_DN27019_c0_g1~~TRINITY_DN27019_c0_g1_i1.p1  ORF type:complete len:209 (-),score=77.95 TRINITY_DN27019_c0_g1_i1:300-872(-)